MKFYKRSSINQHDPMSNDFAVSSNGMILTKSVIGQQLPSGPTTNRPGGTNFPTEPVVAGTVRYNSTLLDLEVYERGQWERIRTVRPATINVQNLGNGNYQDTLFGPLNGDYAASQLMPGSANTMVYIDNVYQIPVLNYSIGTTPAAINAPVVATAFTGTNTVQVTSIVNIITATGAIVSVSGVGIAPNTKVINRYSETLRPPDVPNTVTNNYIVVSIPVVQDVPLGTVLVLTYNTGNYITFTGTVPTKPVVALHGFDGYFPPG